MNEKENETLQNQKDSGVDDNNQRFDRWLHTKITFDFRFSPLIIKRTWIL